MNTTNYLTVPYAMFDKLLYLTKKSTINHKRYNLINIIVIIIFKIYLNYK